jgi:hypothetical protein
MGLSLQIVRDARKAATRKLFFKSFDLVGRIVQEAVRPMYLGKRVAGGRSAQPLYDLCRIAHWRTTT